MKIDSFEYERAIESCRRKLFDEYGCVLIVHGKTGSRRVRLVWSSSYLASYLDVHPFKGDPNSFLWLTKCAGRINNPELMRDGWYPLGYKGVRNILRKICKKAEP